MTIAAPGRRSSRPSTTLTSTLRSLAVMIATGAAYYVAARLSLHVSLVGRSVTPIWPPTGIAVVAMTLYGMRAWPAIAIAAFAVNLPISPNAAAALTIAAGNTIAPLCAVWLLRRTGFRPALDRLRDAVAIILLAGVLAMMVSASIGTASLFISGAITSRQILATWSVWWAGDAMGVIIIAPFLLSLRSLRRGAPRFTGLRILEAIGLLAAIGSLTYVLFANGLGLLYLTFPFLGLAAWRFRQIGGTTAALLASSIAISTAVRGTGVFSGGSLFHEMVVLQVFNCGASFASFVFAAMVTEREDTLKALKHATENLEGQVARRTAQLLQAQQIAHIGSWEWNVASDTFTWSDELCRIHGVDPATFHATYQTFLEMVHHEDRSRVSSAISEALARGGSFAFDYRIVRTDGTVRILHARGETHGLAGTPTGMSGTGQDITEWRRAEEAVRTAFEREREAGDRLRTLDEMKNSFLRAVSHELRTPLTAILGLAETMDRPDVRDDPAMIREFTPRLSFNARRLLGLLTDLLDLDRLNRGAIHAHRRPTDLRELVKRIVDALVLGERVVIDVPALTANVDSVQVERIVENLVVNATKYTPPGSLIRVRAERAGEGTLLAVEDSGPGIPDDLKEKIFDTFKQGPTPAHAPGGTGVGLSLVRHFAALHGGRAWVEDRPGGGAAFFVFLPDGSAELPVISRDELVS